MIDVVGEIRPLLRDEPVVEHREEFLPAVDLVSIWEREKRLKPCDFRLKSRMDVDKLEAIFASRAVDLGEAADGIETPCNGILPGNKQGVKHVIHNGMLCQMEIWRLPSIRRVVFKQKFIPVDQATWIRRGQEVPGNGPLFSVTGTR